MNQVKKKMQDFSIFLADIPGGSSQFVALICGKREHSTVFPRHVIQ
jgi:hypothetical protein